MLSRFFKKKSDTTDSQPIGAGAGPAQVPARGVAPSAAAQVPSVEESVANLQAHHANLLKRLQDLETKEREYTNKIDEYRKSNNVGMAKQYMGLKRESERQKIVIRRNIAETMRKLRELQPHQQRLGGVADEEVDELFNRLGGKGRRKTRKGKSRRRVTRRR